MSTLSRESACTSTGEKTAPCPRSTVDMLAPRKGPTVPFSASHVRRMMRLFPGKDHAGPLLRRNHAGDRFLTSQGRAQYDGV